MDWETLKIKVLTMHEYRELLRSGMIPADSHLERLSTKDFPLRVMVRRVEDRSHDCTTGQNKILHQVFGEESGIGT